MVSFIFSIVDQVEKENRYFRLIQFRREKVSANIIYYQFQLAKIGDPTEDLVSFPIDSITFVSILLCLYFAHFLNSFRILAGWAKDVEGFLGYYNAFLLGWRQTDGS